MRKVFFRCDSSFDIGSGHVIRCLTLANFLKKKGFSTTFLCRKVEGNLFKVILNNDHKLVALSNNKSKRNFSKNDALEVIKKVKNLNLTDGWMVVDHYLLNKDWEKKISSYFSKLFIIDDLCLPLEKIIFVKYLSNLVFFKNFLRYLQYFLFLAVRITILYLL